VIDAVSTRARTHGACDRAQELDAVVFAALAGELAARGLFAADRVWGCGLILVFVWAIA
jgi:hypothetical protein